MDPEWIAAVIGFAGLLFFASAFWIRDRVWGGAAAIILGSSGVLLMAIGAVCGGVFAASRAACEAEADGLGLRAHYSAMTDCRVELPDGRLVDIEKYRILIDETGHE